MKKTTTLIWGAALIALGVILGVNALGIAHINIFFPGWWTLFIIVPSLVSIFANKGIDMWDVVCLIVGVALLLACQGVIAFGVLWKLLVPAILIVFGLSLVFKDALQKRLTDEMKKLREETDKDEDYWSIFSGQTIDYAKKKYKGGHYEAVFGGIRCDLREAKIEKDVLIRASAVFGGVTILVPDDVNVEVVASGFFGGVEDKINDQHKKHDDRDEDEDEDDEDESEKGSKEDKEDKESKSEKGVSKVKDDGKKTIYVEASAVFGGVEIK